MFVDMPWPTKDDRPERPRRRLSDREQKVLLCLIGINLLLLLVAPVGGATLLQLLFRLSQL